MNDALCRAAAEAGFESYAAVLIRLRDPRVMYRTGGADDIYPASMIKTPIAVAIAGAERDGHLRWTDRITIDAANLTVNDAPSPLAAGVTSTVAELVELMLARSDNVATNVLVDLVRRHGATNALNAWGLTRTEIRRKVSGALPLIADPGATGRNAHPAAEAAQLFARLALDELPGTAVIRGALGRQYWNTKLSAGLGAGDSFEHKTGDTDDVSHDGGIVTCASGVRYAIAVYTALPSGAETDARFARFMRALRPDL